MEKTSFRAVFFADIVPVPAPSGLGPALEAHWSTLRAPARLAASLAAWTLLRDALNVLGYAAGEVAFGENGKPFLLGGGIEFSLSHDDALCAVSLSNAPTGVDVERANRMIAPSLRKRLSDGDPIERWCALEAYLKHSGEGWTKLPEALPIPERIAFRRVTDARGDAHLIAAAFDGTDAIQWNQRRIDT